MMGYMDNPFPELAGYNTVQTSKVVKVSVEHLRGRKDAGICAVHDRTLSREAVEDESHAFRVRLRNIGGIMGDDPGR